MQATKDPFADLASDDLDGPAYDSHKPAAPEGPVLYRATCKKCGGSGRYNAPSSLGHQLCTRCKGKGYQETRVPPEKREARAARRAARKEKKVVAAAQVKQEQAATWALANPAETQWLADNWQRSEFAHSLRDALAKWGSLTERQTQAVRNCIAKDMDRAAERAARGSRAEAVDITPIITAFDKASGSLRAPRLLTPDFQFKKASALGRNPGAIYVTDRGTDLYLGKIIDGQFHPARECTPEMQARVMECCKNPLEAVLAFARLTGQCGVCARKLTDAESVARGIGPICADKYGF